MFKRLIRKIGKLTCRLNGKAIQSGEQELYSIDKTASVRYHPKTFHGLHYEEQDFDAEVDQRTERRIADLLADGNSLSAKDREAIYIEVRRNVYQVWNHCDDDQVERFETVNTGKNSNRQN